jgi:hypothetical protein
MPAAAPRNKQTNWVGCWVPGAPSIAAVSRWVGIERSSTAFLDQLTAPSSRPERSGVEGPPHLSWPLPLPVLARHSGAATKSRHSGAARISVFAFALACSFCLSFRSVAKESALVLSVACSSSLFVFRCHPERVFRARRTPTKLGPPQPPTPFSHKSPPCLSGGSRGLQPP